MATYEWTARLDATLRAAGIPIWGCADITQAATPYPPEWHVVDRTDGVKVRIDYQDSATSGQITQGDNIALTFDVRPYRTRRLADIFKDVQALTASQQQKVWADLSAAVPGDVPRKYLASVGPNAASIFVMDWCVYVFGGTAAQQKASQNDLISMYVQDNPAYLRQPSFDPTINISGTEPIP